MSKKTVVITGSSRGIGRACAILFAKNNYNVVINYNKSKELAEELFNNLKEAGYSVDIFKADISNRFEANSLINHCIGKFGKIDVLINNAGISQNKLFTDIRNYIFSTFYFFQYFMVFILFNFMFRFFKS